MDKYTIVIILTAIGFFALAALLLVPIWRFLDSEEKRADEWTREASGSPPAETEEPVEDSGARDNQRRDSL